MFIKILSAVMLTGSLVVAGDATFQKIGCPLQFVCSSFSGCCHTSYEKPSCCSTKSTSPSSDCCSAPSRSAAKPSCCAQEPSCCSESKQCCDAAIVYCTRTGYFYEGCCCEIVNGRHRCTITGEISDECCCIPVQE